jgi:hypothetical protein
MGTLNPEGILAFDPDGAKKNISRPFWKATVMKTQPMVESEMFSANWTPGSVARSDHGGMYGGDSSKDR